MGAVPIKQVKVKWQMKRLSQEFTEAREKLRQRARREQRSLSEYYTHEQELYEIVFHGR